MMINNAKICGSIWMLHRVAPNREETEFQRFDRNTRITPNYLENIIQDAKISGYNFISLDDLLAKLKNGQGDKKDIVISIDDGYRDIYQYAFPIFQKHNIPFVFYVASDFIECGFERCRRPEIDGGQLAMDLIYHNKEFTIDGEYFPAQTKEEKARCFDKMWKVFKRLKKKNPKASSRELFRCFFPGYQLDFDKYFKEYVCSPEELQKMADSGLGTIASHGKSHTPLEKIRDSKLLMAEFTESKNVLEKLIGREVKHFSYPYGSYTNKTIKLAKKHYQSAACVTKDKQENVYVMSEDNLFLLPRIGILQGCNPLLLPQVPAKQKKWYQFWL